MARRQSLALTGSLILHGIPLLWGLLTFGPSFEMPEIEFEFEEVEMIDPDQLQADEPVPPDPVVAPVDTGEDSEEPEGDTKEEPEKKDDEGKEEEPKERLGEKQSRVDQLGPTNSTFYALMVNKRVRKLPFAERGVDVMAPLPDFQFLVQGGGFHALHDFDYLVLASPDLRDVTQTFLAVEYNLPRSEMQAGVDRAVEASNQVITWEERGGFMMGNPRPADPERPDIDPRWIVFMEDNVAVFVREEFLTSVLEGTPDDGRKTAGNFVTKLTRMRQFAAREPRAAMQIKLKDLHAALKSVRGLPFKLPNDIEITIEASKDPEVALEGEFLSAADARTFYKWYQEDLAAIIEGDLKIKLAAGWIHRLLEVEHTDRRVALRGTFTQDQAETILQLAGGFSRQMVHKTPEEMEADRRAREAAWKRRRGGKLTPSQALGGDETLSGDAGDPELTEDAPGSPPREPVADPPAPTSPSPAPSEPPPAPAASESPP